MSALPSPTVKLPDCQLNWDEMQRRVPSLLQFANPGAAPLVIDAGLSFLSFATSQTSAALVISHGLGRSPRSVQATMSDHPECAVGVVATSATTITLRGYFIPGPTTGPIPVSWLVIG